MKLRTYFGLIGMTGMIALAIASGVDRATAQTQPPAAGAAEQVTPQPAQPGGAATGAVGSGQAQSGAQVPNVTQPDPQKAVGPDVSQPGAGADPAKNQSSSGTNPGGPADPKAVVAAVGKPWFQQLAERPIDEDGTFWMPKGVNKVAHDSDDMFYVVLGLSAFFFFAITGAIVYFTIKYRHRPGHTAQPSPGHNDALEVTWTVIPTIICVFLFYYGWRSYVRIVTPPQKAVEIAVQAWRWNWEFTHANGVTDSDLHVPLDTPVRLVMTSRDVLHAFYVPVMRVKQDIIPRRYTYAWFHPEKPGTYRLQCAEYCGTDHSQMGRTKDGRRVVVVVHKSGGYEQYLSDLESEGNDDPVALGAKLYEKKGCVACHSVDGSAKTGPTFKGTYGTEITLAGGAKVTVDENYLRQSIEVPNAKARPGYPVGVMPAFEGQLKPKQLEGLIAYIKSLK